MGEKRSRKREEEGEWYEKSGRTDAVDDRTSVYPPAKPLPEFIIICSTTGAVCGLRPWGTRLLWYQIILWRNKKVHLHIYTRTLLELLRKRTHAWSRNLRDTTGHGWRCERRHRRFRKVNFGPVFHHFHSGRKAVSFPRPSATIRSVKVRCFKPHDDNARRKCIRRTCRQIRESLFRDKTWNRVLMKKFPRGLVQFFVHRSDAL